MDRKDIDSMSDAEVVVLAGKRRGMMKDMGNEMRENRVVDPHEEWDGMWQMLNFRMTPVCMADFNRFKIELFLKMDLLQSRLVGRSDYVSIKDDVEDLVSFICSIPNMDE